MQERKNLLDVLKELDLNPEKTKILLDFLKELAHEDTSPKRTITEIYIFNLLDELGAPCRFSGREYILEATQYVLIHGKVNFSKELYPHIAKKFDSTPSRVERDIRVIIEKCFEQHNEQLLSIFQNTINPKSGKVTNSEFIYGLANYTKKNVYF